MILPRFIADKILARNKNKAGTVNITVTLSDADLDNARRRVLELSDVMQNYGNPAVREAHLDYMKRRNFGQ